MNDNDIFLAEDKVKVDGDVYTRRVSNNNLNNISSDNDAGSFINFNKSLLSKNNSRSNSSTDISEPTDESSLLKIETEFEFSKSFLEKQPKKSCFSCPKINWEVCLKGIKTTFINSFPILEWLPKYEFKKYLALDFVLGLTLAFVMAPKAMAHALLANLPPYVGLYTILFSTLIYGVMGNSKWLSLTTAALPALLYGDALDSLDLKSTDEYSKIAPMLTFYVGIFTWALLILRVDKFIRFIPPIVLKAFSTTAAFLIGTSQVKYMFGIPLEAKGFAQTYIELFKNIHKTNVATLILTLFCIFYLLLSKYVITPNICKKFKIPDTGALVVVIFSVSLIAIFDLDEKFGIATAGSTPDGLPQPTLPWEYITSSEWHSKLALEGAILAIINIILVITIAKSFAVKSKSVVVIKQEMKAVASVNTILGCFGGMVSGGSFSGSAIIASLGADTLMHNLINSLVVLLILLFMTPLIELLPKATLAAIIIAALPSLIDFKTPKLLFQVKLDDFFLWVGTFLITLFAGVQIGIISGTCLALVVLIKRNSSDESTELGVLPGTTIYRSLERFPDAQIFNGIKIIRIDCSLSFANFETLEKKLMKHLESITFDPNSPASPFEIKNYHDYSKTNKKNIKKNNNSYQEEKDLDFGENMTTIILSCEGVNDIDTPAIEMLCRFSESCKKQNVQLLFAGWKANVRQILYAAHLLFVDTNKQVKPNKKSSNSTALNKNIPVGNSLDSSDKTSSDIDLPLDIIPSSQNNNIEKEPFKNLPSPLNPNSWFLNLHDAVYRATSDDNCQNEIAIDIPKKNESENNNNNNKDSFVDWNQNGWSSRNISIRVEEPGETTKRRTASGSVLKNTTEVTSSGSLRSWNYSKQV